MDKISYPCSLSLFIDIFILFTLKYFSRKDAFGDNDFIPNSLNKSPNLFLISNKVYLSPI